MATFLAEGEGFEPPEPFPVQWFSRPPPSTTRPSLHTGNAREYSELLAALILRRVHGIARRPAGGWVAIYPQIPGIIFEELAPDGLRWLRQQERHARAGH